MSIHNFVPLVTWNSDSMTLAFDGTESVTETCCQSALLKTATFDGSCGALLRAGICAIMRASEPSVLTHAVIRTVCPWNASSERLLWRYRVQRSLPVLLHEMQITRCPLWGAAGSSVAVKAPRGVE